MLQLLCGVAALATACADSPAPPAMPIEKTTFAPSLDVQLGASIKRPSGLYVRDVIVGTGDEAKPTNVVEVHYDGRLADGTQFDENAAGETPLNFRLGLGEVIPGWDEGVTGMKVGGKRQLIIPPALAYGEEGIGPIPPNAILVFTVELVRVRPR
jgi:peptidylprolyl isomerase